jgi:chromosomal replication initiator protein
MGKNVTPEEAWRRTYSQLEVQYDSDVFRTWLKPLTLLRHEGTTFVLGTPNAYAIDQLTHRIGRGIRRILSDAYGSPVELTFEVVHSQPASPAQDNYYQEMPLFQFVKDQPIGDSSESTPNNPTARPQRDTLPESILNKRYTFDRFIVSNANKMVYEAARAVADNPFGNYNPLMVYGGVGCGKTHLLHAIAHECVQRGLKTLYITSEMFTNDLIDAIRKHQQAMFRERYRTVDVLLVDDIQFLSGKESTQEEFFHTFNALYTFNKQIVLASDRHPDRVATLQDRLRSRFAGGLIVDVQPPETETRIAIMKMWLEEQGTQLDFESLEMIAKGAPNNIRELEGMFNKLVMKARLSTNHSLSHAQVSQALARLESPRPSAPKTTTLEQVIEATARVFQLKSTDLIGTTRVKRINEARQVAMYLARELTEASYPQIGSAFGGRSHSTVHHSCKKIEDDLAHDSMMSDTVHSIRQALQKD